MLFNNNEAALAAASCDSEHASPPSYKEALADYQFGNLGTKTNTTRYSLKELRKVQEKSQGYVPGEDLVVAVSTCMREQLGNLREMGVFRTISSAWCNQVERCGGIRKVFDDMDASMLEGGESCEHVMAEVSKGMHAAWASKKENKGRGGDYKLLAAMLVACWGESVRNMRRKVANSGY